MPMSSFELSGGCSIIGSEDWRSLIFFPVTSSLDEKSRKNGLLPMSADVEMYSLPYTPSLVGRTISDMSVQMPSKPSPPNAPLYPIPFTGIFPVDASFQIVKTASGVQNESPSLL